MKCIVVKNYKNCIDIDMTWHENKMEHHLWQLYTHPSKIVIIIVYYDNKIKCLNWIPGIMIYFLFDIYRKKGITQLFCRNRTLKVYLQGKSVIIIANCYHGSHLCFAEYCGVRFWQSSQTNFVQSENVWHMQAKTKKKYLCYLSIW